MSARTADGRTFDVRVIAATNRDLALDVKEKRFREDLFYRLKVVELVVPPLRDRPEDVRGLAEAILARVARQMRRPITAYSPAALEQILRYPWPGTIRELENAIERACAVATGEVVELTELIGRNPACRCAPAVRGSGPTSTCDTARRPSWPRSMWRPAA